MSNLGGGNNMAGVILFEQTVVANEVCTQVYTNLLAKVPHFGTKFGWALGVW